MIFIIRALSQRGKDDGDYGSPTSRDETSDFIKRKKRKKKRKAKKGKGQRKKRKRKKEKKGKENNNTSSILTKQLCPLKIT